MKYGRQNVLRNIDSTENKNPGFFYYNQMIWKVEERNTVKLLSPNHHDFKFPGGRGHDRKLNASPFPLSSLPPPSNVDGRFGPAVLLDTDPHIYLPSVGTTTSHGDRRDIILQFSLYFTCDLSLSFFMHACANLTTHICLLPTFSFLSSFAVVRVESGLSEESFPIMTGSYNHSIKTTKL